MIRLLGSQKQLCDGLTRRDLLHVGSVSCLGLGIDAWERRMAMAATGAEPSGGGALDLPGFGRAKACILLFL
ncbi:MAG: hypothetical protein RLY70_1030, partial [Planctomycetota bacterium]